MWDRPPGQSIAPPPPRKHWLDYVAAAIVTGGFLASAWSANNGTKQLKLAAATTERQLRAYVMPNSIMVEHFGTSEPVIAKVQLKNSGQTPAYKVQAWMTFVPRNPLFSDFTPPENVTYNSVFMSSQGTLDMELGISKMKEGPYITLQSQDMNLLKTGKMTLYIYGEIEYEDTFGIGRHTSFRAMVPTHDEPVGSNQVMKAQPLLTGNDAD